MLELDHDKTSNRFASILQDGERAIWWNVETVKEEPYFAKFSKQHPNLFNGLFRGLWFMGIFFLIYDMGYRDGRIGNTYRWEFFLILFGVLVMFTAIAPFLVRLKPPKTRRIFHQALLTDKRLVLFRHLRPALSLNLADISDVQSDFFEGSPATKIHIDHDNDPVLILGQFSSRFKEAIATIRSGP